MKYEDIEMGPLQSLGHDDAPKWTQLHFASAQNELEWNKPPYAQEPQAPPDPGLVRNVLGYLPDPMPETWEEVLQLVRERCERDVKTTSYLRWSDVPSRSLNWPMPMRPEREKEFLPRLFEDWGYPSDLDEKQQEEGE